MPLKKWSKTLKRVVYYARVIDEKGKRHIVGPSHTSSKLVKEYEDKKKKEFAERKMFPERFPESVKFRDFVPEYLQKHALKKRSLRDYISISKKLIEFFGEYFFDQITRYHVETYQSTRFEKVGVYMRNREINILKGVFTKAIDWGFLFKNPVKGIKLEKEKPRFRFLTEVERERIIDACGKERKALYLRSMVIIDLFTGLRKEELLNLTWRAVDLEKDILCVEDGKGGEQRRIPINPTAKSEFLRLADKRHGDHVFHDRYGRPFKDIKKSFHSAVERAGLVDVRFHDLRRTFATMCIFKNISPKTLMKWMGHKSIETTMKYYVVSPEEYEVEAIKRLDGNYRATGELVGHGESSQPLDNIGEPCRIRTCDPLIKSPFDRGRQGFENTRKMATIATLAA
jgi:integrase